jgi:hypothetical protein
MSADPIEGPYQIFSGLLENKTPSEALDDLRTLAVPATIVEANRPSSRTRVGRPGTQARRTQTGTGPP